jgi:hypothetical protein
VALGMVPLPMILAMIPRSTTLAVAPRPMALSMLPQPMVLTMVPHPVVLAVAPRLVILAMVSHPVAGAMVPGTAVRPFPLAGLEGRGRPTPGFQHPPGLGLGLSAPRSDHDGYKAHQARSCPTASNHDDLP